MESVTNKEIGEEQLKLTTLEDCLSLALKLRILEKSPSRDVELLAHRLCLRLCWLLCRHTLISPARWSAVHRLQVDLSRFLAQQQRHEADLRLYQEQ